MPIRNLTHGSLVIQDGTSPTPLSIGIACQKGDLKWSRTKEAKVVKNRGRLYEKTQGEEMVIPISFSGAFERLTAKPNEDPTPYEALHQEGPAAGWVSTLPNKLNSPFGVDLVFTLADVEGADAGGENEIMTFEKFTIDKFDFAEGGDANEFTVTGSCLSIKPSVDSNPTV